MELMTSQQVRGWYNASLNYSGYISLESWCLDIYNRLVKDGYMSLPPGFVASSLARLTHRTTGEMVKENNKLEEKLLNLISQSRGFVQLEGEFLLQREKKEVADKCFAVEKRIIEKLGSFYHPLIVFSINDLQYALQLEETPTENFSTVLDEIYKKSIDYSIRNNSKLDQYDIFEISHPQLFVSPGARSLYLKMMCACRELNENIAGEQTLEKENDNVVACFGEPQTLPLGGYDSITCKGELSSLIPSELSYIEEKEDIDYFDYKFIQNELLFFKREEGLIFRIRRWIHLVIDLDYYMEHERYLADLLAFCTVFSEKVLSVFVKDVVLMDIDFTGNPPSEIRSAIDFLKHYIDESIYKEKIFIDRKINREKVVVENKNYQHWYIGPNDKIKTDKSIFFDFPDLTAVSENDKYYFLAEEIDHLINKMVEIAYY